MIIVRLMGGLGNQMFQYAAGRSLAVKQQTALKFDSSFFANEALSKDVTKRELELSIFDIPMSFADSTEIMMYKKDWLWKRIAKRSLSNIGLKFPAYYRENGYQFNPIFETLHSKVYLEGYWQTEKYFSSIGEIIRKDFQFRFQPTGINKELIPHILSTNSVSIHVRRGDYVSDPKTNQYHGLCSIEYYQAAIKSIASKIRNPHFFVFSDDISWTKGNILVGNCPVTHIDHNRGKQSFEDLRLMSLCKHNIIANSSFSWWGAWLNNNNEKIVIAPEKWFNNDKINTQDLIPWSWIRI